MSNIKLNLAEFKHHSSDDKSTTLQHKDGHTITLAHSALSKQAQEQLKHLAASAKPSAEPKEAKANYAYGSPEPISADDVAPTTPDTSAMPMTKPYEMMSPEERANFHPQVSQPIEGEPIASMAPKFEPDAIPAKDPTKFENYSPEDKARYQDYVKGGRKGSFEPTPQAPEAAQASDLNVAPQAMATPQGVGQEAQAMQGQQTIPGQGLGQPSNPMDNTEGMLRSGFSDKLKGLQQQASAQAHLGDEMAKQRESQIQAQELAQKTYKDSYASLEQERQALQEDVRNGQVDPEKYWTNHSKLAAGIGMIIAGFNPTNNPNAAIGFLKNQMELNIRAQEKNLDSKNNLLRANLQQFGNLKDATTMTRIMQNDMMENQLQLAAAKAQSPMAKAQLLQAAGQLKMEAAPMFQQFAMRRAMMNLSNGPQGQDPSNTAPAEHMIQMFRAMGNTEMAHDLESKLIPGVGMAKIPVPESARKEMVEKNSLNTAANDLMAYSKKHTNLVPGTPEYNYGVGKAIAFQQKVREGLLGTVFRESEKPLLEKFVNENPAGAFKSFSTQPKLKAIIDSNMQGLNAIKQAYGLPQQQPAQSNEPVMGKDGKMYIRQGNFMVPVSQPAKK